MPSLPEFVPHQASQAARIVAPVEGGGHRLRQIVGERRGQLAEEVGELRIRQWREGGPSGPDPARWLPRHTAIVPGSESERGSGVGTQSAHAGA